MYKKCIDMESEIESCGSKVMSKVKYKNELVIKKYENNKDEVEI